MKRAKPREQLEELQRTAVDIEIDPQGRRFSRRQTDFALQAIVECRAAKAKGVAVFHRACVLMCS